MGLGRGLFGKVVERFVETRIPPRAGGGPTDNEGFLAADKAQAKALGNNARFVFVFSFDPIAINIDNRWDLAGHFRRKHRLVDAVAAGGLTIKADLNDMGRGFTIHAHMAGPVIDHEVLPRLDLGPAKKGA